MPHKLHHCNHIVTCEGTPLLNNVNASNKQTESTSSEVEASGNEDSESCFRSIECFLVDHYKKNEFIAQIIVVILLAKVFPPLGAVYLHPEITSTWIAVAFMFVLAGIGLKTEEFNRAFNRLKFNIFVQSFNFGVVSLAVFGVSRLLIHTAVLSRDLADGMVVCACLPVTIAMILVLTKTAGGDEASAILNAAFGNMLGVFLSPVLILGYLGVAGGINLLDVFYKLSSRVVTPLVVGQVLRNAYPPVLAFHTEHKKGFKMAQQLALVFIVYTVFCKTFAESDGSIQLADALILIIVQFCLLCGLKGLAWWLLGLIFPNKPKLRVMGLFGCTQKTVAMGVPLVNAIYENNPSVGMYTLPLLIWHPMQLLLGSYLAPKLSKWVEREEERLHSQEGAEGRTRSRSVRSHSSEESLII